VASLTNGLAIIETHAIVVPGFEHLEICEFYSSSQLGGDVSNWWGPNVEALEGMCRAAGFVRIEIVRGGSSYVDTAQPKDSLSRKTRNAVSHMLRKSSLVAPLTPEHFRAVVHAWK
jgi:hypothetical protein